MLVNEQDLKTLERRNCPSVSGTHHEKHMITESFCHMITVAKKKEKQYKFSKDLEEEPDGLAKDEDKDKSQQDKASL